MRKRKESSNQIQERKSATPYKSDTPYKRAQEDKTIRNQNSRPVHTVKLPKSQMPSRQTEEHKALQRAKYQKKRRILKSRHRRLSFQYYTHHNFSA